MLIERQPYVYQMVARFLVERPAKATVRELEAARRAAKEPWQWEGCNWDEEVMFQTTDQAEVQDVFNATTETLRRKSPSDRPQILELYLRRLGATAKFAQWLHPEHRNGPARPPEPVKAEERERALTGTGGVRVPSR